MTVSWRSGLSWFVRGALAAAPLRVWAIICAAPALTLFAAWLVHLVADRPWGLPAAQLQILGHALYLVLGLVLVIVVALAAVRLHAHALGGAGLDLGGAGEGDPSTPDKGA